MQRLETPNQLFHRKSCLSDDCTQSSFRNFLVIRHYEASMGHRELSQHDVTAALPVDFVSKLDKRSNQVSTGDSRQNAQPRTSITSSSMGGGAGSPCARKLSR